MLKTSVGGYWAFRQMRELVKLGAEVHVAFPPSGPLDLRYEAARVGGGSRQPESRPIMPQYEAAGVVVHPAQLDFPARQPWRLAKMLKEMRTLVAEVRPDIIHSHYVGTTLTMRLALGKNHPIPRVFQVAGPLHLEHAFFRRAELSTAGRGDYWIGTCKWTCDLYRQSGIAQDHVFLSYHGVDIQDFGEWGPGKLRAELGINGNRKLVGMVGLMYAPKWYIGQRRGVKGHEDFIDAIALCAETNPDILGVIIGGPWVNATGYESRVRAYAQKRCGNRVVFLGMRSDVPALYPDLNVAVYPSQSENIGGAGEALLCAVPTIATNVGGVPEVVKHGETGWLVPPRDPVQLARAISTALREPARCRAMAVEGQNLARHLFDIQERAKQVLGIYETIASRAG